MGNIQLEGSQQIAGALKLSFRFAGETDDDVRGNRNVWDGLADALDQADVIAGGVTALHVRQHLIVACLNWNFDVRHHLRQFRHGIEQFLGHPVGVRGQEADAFQTIYGVDSAQQTCQVRAVCKVLAVAVHNLTQKGDFLDPL